jgi:hypothetical protein
LDVPTSLVAKETAKVLVPKTVAETPVERAVPLEATVYHRIWWALMFVALAVRLTLPDPHLELFAKVNTGAAAFTVTVTDVRLVDSQFAADVWVAKYVPCTSAVEVESAEPPELAVYHLMFVPVATKLATVAPAQNVWLEAVGTVVL